IGRLLTLQDPGGIDATLARGIGNAWPVAHQAASTGKFAVLIDRRNAMKRCKSDNSIALAVKKRGRADQERTSATLGEVYEGGIEIVVGICFENNELDADATRSFGNVPQLAFSSTIIGVHKHGDRRYFGSQFVQQSQPFRFKRERQPSDPRDVAAGSVQAGNQPNSHRVGGACKNNRNCRRRGLGSECSRRAPAACCSDHCHLAANQITRERRQSVKLIPCPAVFDCHVAAFNNACFIQTSSERGRKVRGRGGLWRTTAQESDRRHRRLLCARRERPYRRAAEQFDELAPLHSITSSARNKSDAGMDKPKASAVRKFKTCSNLVGRSIGTSAGLAPCSTFPARTPTRLYSPRRLGP